ncbi:MAG: DUF362 domain-containing protein [Chitinophagaceae bacterium]
MSEAIVTICTDAVADANSLLEQTLQQSRLWKTLEEKRKKANLSKENFSILVKPDIEFYELNATTGTSPQLVEHLISLLAKKGYTKVIVADGEQGSGVWLENRDLLVLADLAGYKYQTPDGIPYNIESLSESLEDANFNDTSVLKGEQLSLHWLNANFRIVFAKNKTDEEFYYSLCLKSLIEILPQKAKQYHYFFRLQPEEVAAAILQRNEVDFCIIDAYESNHGMQGTRHNKPLLTQTFIAGDNILLTDWASALKMGLDPYSSSINSYSLKKFGLPVKHKINGELFIYNDWQNVTKFLAESTQARNKNPVVRQLSKAWLQQVDTDNFPFKNVTDSQINKFLVPITRNIDTHPLAHSALVALNYSLGGIQQFMEGWQTLFDKEKVYRQDRELGFDVTQYSPEDFEAIENYILPLAQLAAQTPPDANGIKWRYIDTSVIFEYSRTLPYDYKSFITKVDIAQAVQYMFDNIGGARVPVKTNNKEQIIYQAERDIYLPQPNWMVMFGGKPIDVCKIEVIRYTANSQTILWRTVSSPNQSAEFDDGLVSFTARQKGITEIKIVARQKFALPIFWQVVNMDYLPVMKDALVSDSYLRFFTRTMSNFEAVYEGRNPRLGKTPDPVWGETDQRNHPLQAEQFKNLFAIFSGIAEKFIGKKGVMKNSITTDEDGYTHFEGNESSASETLRSFVTDVSTAIQKDVKYITGIK